LLRNPFEDEMTTGRPANAFVTGELGPVPNRDDWHRVRDLREG
jgi:hypothetical protein